MSDDRIELARPTLSLREIGRLLRDAAHEASFLIVAPPGVGKSDTVAAAAAAAGLPCRSLLGTQLAPEDVSGVPRIQGERTVFCPPRSLVPEDGRPVCLFLDELPAASWEVQKALYPLLLDRRVGEFPLPAGSWVVAAGNREADRALARTLSSALVNRVFVVEARADHKEWLAWATRAGVRPEVIAFIAYLPSALLREPPEEPGPFSTPRAWASLGRALDLVEARGPSPAPLREALAHGRVSGGDAALFASFSPERLAALGPVEGYVRRPERYLCLEASETWLLLRELRTLVGAGRLRVSQRACAEFLRLVPADDRMALLVGLVDEWARLAPEESLLDPIREVLAA